MSNPHQHLYEYCKVEKERAVALSNSPDRKTHYNACQAINAWDELMGQLYKHKPTNKKRFEKTKETALFIVNLMHDSQYKDQTISKIKQLSL